MSMMVTRNLEIYNSHVGTCPLSAHCAMTRLTATCVTTYHMNSCDAPFLPNLSCKRGGGIPRGWVVTRGWRLYSWVTLVLIFARPRKGGA